MAALLAESDARPQPGRIVALSAPPRFLADRVSATLLQSFEPESTSRTLHFTNGDVYEGETLAELRHGQGKHTCSNGDSHQGLWYKGMRHGHGVAVFARGFFYEGDFEYDHAHGSGKAKYESGSVYEGEFECDQRSGWGVQCFPDESTYVGEWKHDSMTGTGRLTSKDGEAYQGTWKGGERLEGKWMSADGQQEYAGAWKGQARHGTGTLHVRGLYQYTGAWKNGVQHGEGKCRWVDGSTYAGQWCDGCRHGRGVMVRADGYKYAGFWQEDKENGSGVLRVLKLPKYRNARLCNGGRYTGDFRDGLPHGHGRMQSADRGRYEGAFLGGKRQGHGRCILPNGDKYIGDWAGDKREGQGVCHFADGTVFKGSWHDGQWIQSEAEPGLSKVAGVGLAIATAGQAASFTILAKDNLHNKRLAGGDTFMVWLEGPATVHAAVADNDDGSYIVDYCATTAGMYDLYITNDTGESVAESPYILRVMPAAPDPRKSTVKLSASATPATVGCNAAFVVEARDCYGNRCKAVNLLEQLPLAMEATCGAATCELQIEKVGSGRYNCSLLPPVPGFYRVSITSKGKALCNTPISVEAKVRGGDIVSKAALPADCVLEWTRKAAAQYADDGNAEGWSSDASEPENAEQTYLKDHPDVPVVADLKDMWKLTKLQGERKRAEEHAKAVSELQALKVASGANKHEPKAANTCARGQRPLEKKRDAPKQLNTGLKGRALSDPSTSGSGNSCQSCLHEASPMEAARQQGIAGYESS